AVRPPRGVSILPVAARSSAPSTRPRRRQLTLAVLLGLDVIDPLPGGLPRTIVARIPDGRLERRQRSVVLLLLREAVAEQHVGLIRAAQASHPQPFASRIRALFPLTELCVRLREHDAELAVVGHLRGARERGDRLVVVLRELPGLREKPPVLQRALDRAALAALLEQRGGLVRTLRPQGELGERHALRLAGQPARIVRRLE